MIAKNLTICMHHKSYVKDAVLEIFLNISLYILIMC